jgi:hypothetical protein
MTRQAVGEISMPIRRGFSRGRRTILLLRGELAFDRAKNQQRNQGGGTKRRLTSSARRGSRDRAEVQGCSRRKNKIPGGGVIVRLLFVPSSAMP